MELVFKMILLDIEVQVGCGDTTNGIKSLLRKIELAHEMLY